MANLWKVLPSSAPAGGSPIWTGKTTASIAADAMFARSLVASFSVKEASVDSASILVLPKLGRRTTTARLRKHVQSVDEPSVKVFLITIYHDDLSEPIRVCSDAVERLGSDEYNVYYGVVSNDRTFFFAGFEACLVNDEDGAAPQVQISIPNADRSMTEAIEQMGPGPAKVDIEIVFSDTPDVIEVALTGMEMVDITYDETTITGTVSRDLLFTEPYPSRSFTPKDYPFLFSTRTTK